jgi:hypothetical protein
LLILLPLGHFLVSCPVSPSSGLGGERVLDLYSSSVAAFDKKVAIVPRGFSLKAAEINQLTLDTVYDLLLREKVLVLV